ncbi:MarR family winged helix-turn-helix transcriptional regulator [Streptomyces sp. H27-D2]|uniref:MarR family winged helix-turn-helix transcriptional regulator n=1 Tax=Streptomyces sp. H27-D2 TaxID=3046304 RepID=UPI002DBD48D2|nr:MarR family winged helix-turn-helix transcriptional regulator [Streptomyces sp. H27-D2]MEC4018526.1 MarR family winged helix-turn-helix transcriptional regulator [Streptomyces sp. H27-D2]
MARSTIPATADPDATDDMLATQPIGYWSGVANEMVIKRIRDAMARMDVTQPQWWTLCRVDIGGDGPTREEVATQLASVADGPYEISRAVDQLLHRGWLSADAGRRLHLTDAGRAAKARIKQLVTDLRAEIHDGITDEEYVTALKVLRRMIHNLGGPATLR